MPRKLVYFDYDFLSRVVQLLNSHENKFNTPYTAEVRSFIKDILSEVKESTQLTLLRSTTLSIDITSFYFHNRIEFESEVKEFLNTIDQNIEGGLAKIFFKTAHEISNILKELPKRRFLDADVYFCRKETLEQIKTIKEEYELNLTSSYEKRYLAFSNILNILNEKDACFDYSVSYNESSKTISEVDSVHKYIGGEYSVWKHRLEEDSEDFIRTHLTNTLDIQRKRQETTKKIAQAKDEYDFLVSYLKNEIPKIDRDKKKKREGYKAKVRIISYADANLHPKMKISIKGSSNSKHLRSTTSNLLWFEPQMARGDMEVDEFIKRAKNPFGHVYYLETIES